MRRTLSVMAILASAAAACSLINGLDEFERIEGERPTGGTGATGGTGGGTGGGGGCADPATDCPPTGTECVVAVCESNVCGQQVAPEGTPCTTNSGAVCDNGVCVECIDAADCASGKCENSLCVGTCGSVDTPTMPPSCQSGNPGAGNNCGPSNNANCCENKLVPCGTYLRSYDGVTYTDAFYPATVSDFRLDTYEITVGRFRAFVNAGQGTQANPPPAGAGVHPNIPNSGWNSDWNLMLAVDTGALMTALRVDGNYATWTDSPGPNEKRPINFITWYEAFAFCAWDEGRLPTEVEWNYAAAGGEEQREYPWGSTVPDDTYAVYDCTGDGSAAGQCALSDILAVGSRSPKGDGRWGQADLAGSMWEWTLDLSDSYTVSCNDCANTIGASARVVRGGSFSNDASNLRAAGRNSDYPTARHHHIGARCARTP